MALFFYWAKQEITMTEEEKQKRREYHIKHREEENAKNRARYHLKKQDPTWLKNLRERNKKNSAKYRKKARQQFKEKSLLIKNRWIQFLGGKCSSCGSTQNLEFHHKDPRTKEMNLGNSWTHDPKKVEAEVKKCILLCKKCHRELHKREGTWGAIKSVRCIETNKVYMSLAACEKDMNIDHREISLVCLKKKENAQGYHFEYVK